MIDVNKTTKGDMALISKLLPFTAPENIPLTFLCGDRRINGVPAEFSPVVSRGIIDNNITRTTISGVNSEGLAIKVLYTEYRDFPVTEWVAYISNEGASNTPVLSDIKIGCGTFEGTNATLLHGNGDTLNTEGYEYYYDKVESDILLYPEGGNPCKEALPYMRLIFDGYSINMAIGWSAQWEAKFAPEKDGNGNIMGVNFYAKQQRTRMYLKAGETIRTPRMTFMGFEGDESRGRNMWRRWYFKHIIPKENGKPLPSKLALHTWHIQDMEEFCGCNEENQIEAIDTYIKRGLKPDIWWIDAGWYPCDNHWGTTGNWSVNKENFPNTMMPLSKKCEAEGISFLLWFEPERIRRGTEFQTTLGDWVLDARDRDGNYLLDLGNKECCDWLIERIDALIKENGVHIYRQDFNFAPLYTWIQYETADRMGMMENQHVQGYLRFWDALIERNPGLWIDCCASGGRRNDLDTLRRAVPLHYTDIGYGNHPVKQKQHREMFEWMPYFRAHTMRWDKDGEYRDWDMQPVDKFAFHCAFAPAVTCMAEYYDNDEVINDCTSVLPVWRRAADLMLTGDYYPLTECRKDASDYYAMQFDDPEQKKGFFQVVRNIKCEEQSFTVMPFAVPEETYSFENMETGEKFTLTGEEFAKGYTVTIPKRSGSVWFYERF